MAEESAKNEEINRLFYLQSLYNQQYEAVLSEITTFSLAQSALERNMEFLGKKDRVKGANMLVNAEGGTYFEANIKDINKVITYVGAGYLVEKSTEQAKTFLGKSLETSRDQIKKLIEDKRKLEDELMKLQYSIDVMRQGQ